MSELHNRDIYLNKLINFKDLDIIKVITGIRRCGKSSLLKLMIKHLKENGINNNQIIEINFESFDFRNFSVEDLYNYVKKRVVNNKKTYLFFDEIQRIQSWEDAINSFRIDFDCDIYITGSNAFLLSSEYSTYLSGRSIEIKMLPLSFKEFIQFSNLKIIEKNSLYENEKIFLDNNNTQYSKEEIFNKYIKYGGMPSIFNTKINSDNILTILDSIYSTVVIRDILERGKIQNKSSISDPILLRKIALFLAGNIGNPVSTNKISNVLKNEGLLKNKTKTNPSNNTIQTYINSLLESYIFYDIKRFDIKGKELLRTLGKYYIVDIGLRYYLLGYTDTDRGHIIENIVYLELIRNGYQVYIGKIQDKEIDFIATKAEETIYIQVTESMENENVKIRELSALEKINNNYKKIIISLDKIYRNYNGIENINLIDWLLK